MIMSVTDTTMGPAEEFELHDKHNSWPLLFEVTYSGAVWVRISCKLT